MSIRSRLVRSSLLTRGLLALGIALYRLGLHRLLIRRHAADPKVLLYHACAEEESDFVRGLGSNVRPAELAAQLDFLQRHYRIVPFATLAAGEAPARAVALTFDDGYRSVYAAAFPELARRGLPATLFLVADAVDNRSLIWINELNWLLRRHPEAARPQVAQVFGVPAETPVAATLERLVREYDGVKMRGLLQALRERLGLRAEDLARAARLYLERPEIAEMARHGISFGSHTASHPNLVRLGEAERAGELRRSHALVSALPGARSALAYPFGATDAAVQRSAEEAGYRELLALGGTNRPFDPRRIARVAVRATTPAGLFAEMEVVTPFKARLRRIFPGL